MIGGEVVVEKNPSKKFCIAEKERLCESVIWEMLQSYYKKAAINAWKENVVPSFVTSNSKLAKDYARVIINYMKDWFNSNECDRNVPIYILEIGAGHGKFTYLILRALSKYKKYFKSMNLPDRPFVYVFTDIAKDNITYCMNHDRLKKYINTRNSSDQTFTSKNHSYDDSEFEKNGTNIYDSSTDNSYNSDISSNNETNYYSEEKFTNDPTYSMLDFAFFDGNETTDKIYLEVAKKYIPSNTPIVLICNYVLDSLLTDAWVVKGENDFKRALISVYSPNEEKDKTDADIMLRMTVSWDWESVNIDEEINKEETDNPSDYLRKYKDIYTVLKLYSYIDKHLSFVFPVGAFILFKRMLKLSNNKLLCLIGDKGYQSYEEFKGYRDPHMVVHGSLSFMVNLNAICLFFLSLGGYYIYTPYSDNFQIVTLLMHQKNFKKNELKNDAELSNISQVGENKIEQDNSNEFYIIDFFKNYMKDNEQRSNMYDSIYNQKNNHTSTSSYNNKNNNINNNYYCKNKILKYSKRRLFHDNVYKKIKKINLKNLNNMTIKFGGTISSFYDNVEQFPPDVLINWQKSVIHNINHYPANVNIKELIALLRYSNYDSDVFFNIRNSFINLVTYPNINGRTEKDILLDIHECYKNYYSLKNDEDIADVCGHICMKFGEFEKSIFYLKESLRKFKNNRHSSTYINIASCYKVLRNYNKSLKFIRSSIKLSNKENKYKKYMSPNNNNNKYNQYHNHNSHSYDLLYNIQFCCNPITYAMIGINYYVQNDGIYYLSFENRIKLTHILLLTKEEEAVLKYMNAKYKKSVYEKSTTNVDFSNIKIIKLYDENEVTTLEKLCHEDNDKNNNNNKNNNNKNNNNKNNNNNNSKNDGDIINTNIKNPMKHISYQNAEYLKEKLSECFDKYEFQFCVIDAPWTIKSDIVEMMLNRNKHIFTYGTLSDSSKRSEDIILKYKEKSQQISWINNNYIHDESLYESRSSLHYIQGVTSVTVTHFSMNLYNNMNQSISSKEILINDLCSILNMLQIILNLNLTGLTSNFLKKNKNSNNNNNNNNNYNDNVLCNKGDKTMVSETDKREHQENNIALSQEDNTNNKCYIKEKNNNTVEQDIYDEDHYYCLSGITMFSQQKNISEDSGVYCNYLLMNNKNEEFITKINIVGVNGTLCLKKTISNWSIQIFNINNEKIYDKSGRIATGQNSNDVFINQYLIKTDGKCNNIQHYKEYDLKASCKDSSETIDSDIDILELSSECSSDCDENKDNENNEEHKNKEEILNDSLETDMIPDNNYNKLLIDRNLQILKNVPGKRFYTTDKEIYENMNLDENFIDISVNNNCFYSRIIEGINMSYNKGGIMIHFKYNLV
ncbi:conserved Plasmodium protein, unknown function [Plasmodium gaboni]|uniref:Tetratricopeptide repeat protein n=1 Tax=Plasmodium gaboni TaxID=647221 RepID=A0ABY1UJR3_9APIC|nr:conserved Plasmodium protein, unknown function [Plasmodium gaboni]